MAAILYKWLFFWVMPLAMPPTNQSTFSTAPHPLYISVTEIELNGKEKTLEISCKIFTDDFEKTIEQNYKSTVDLSSPKENAAANNYVSDYVKKHLIITINGKLKALEFIGFETKAEAVYSYYEVKNVSTINKINITNNILYDYRKEQMGIVHVIVDGLRKSGRVNNPDDKINFEF